MKSIFFFIGGNPKQQSLRHMLFNWLTFLNSIANFGGIIVLFYPLLASRTGVFENLFTCIQDGGGLIELFQNRIPEYDLCYKDFLNLATAFIQSFTGVIVIIFWYVSRFKGVYWMFYWPFMILTVLFISVNWFTNSGSSGGAHYYIIVLVIIAAILSRNRYQFYVTVLFLICVTSGLFTLEYLHETWLVNPFDSRMGNYSDKAGQYLFVLLLTGVLVFVLSENLNVEKKFSDKLRRNILPDSIAEELKKK